LHLYCIDRGYDFVQCFFIRRAPPPGRFLPYPFFFCDFFPLWESKKVLLRGRAESFGHSFALSSRAGSPTHSFSSLLSILCTHIQPPFTSGKIVCCAGSFQRSLIDSGSCRIVSLQSVTCIIAVFSLGSAGSLRMFSSVFSVAAPIPHDWNLSCHTSGRFAVGG